MIDVHAHVVLEATLGAAGPYGPEILEWAGQPCFRVGDYTLEGVRYRGTPFMDVDRRLAAMDAAGIERQVLSPNPLTFLHHAPARLAAEFCRRHNDALAELVDRHAGRLRGFAALPMQDPGAAALELERAVRHLGLLGGYVGTDVGRPLDTPELDVVYAACVAVDVPLFVHPAPAGIDGPPADPRLRRFDLDLVVGFAASETLAIAELVYGEVLDRHPGLDVCVSHGGGAAAFLAGRMARAAELRPWSPESLRAPGAFLARLRRLWFDAHVGDAASLALLAERVGRDRLVAGTNFAGWDQPDPPRAPGAGDLAAQLDDNARRLLRLG